MIAFNALIVCALVGCADPCKDDGLNQGDCPERQTATDASQTDATQTETMTVTMTTANVDATDPMSDDTLMEGSGDGFECPDLEQMFAPSTPTFQIVIDKSGSMNDDFGGVTRWEALVDTLVDPGSGVITELESTIRFGVTLYFGEALMQDPPIMTCPNLTEFPPATDAATEIRTFLEGEQPGGQTPTAESLEMIIPMLAADDSPGEKIIVLATDGEPDTCRIVEPAGRRVAEVRGMVVAAVASAYEQGIRTFVISVGNDIAQSHLQDVANAGQGNQPGDPDAEFWVANDQQALVDAFDEIVTGVRPCTFDLDKPLMGSKVGNCSVTINDDPVSYDDPDGWVLPNETRLELQGGACDALQETAEVTIRLECNC